MLHTTLNQIRMHGPCAGGWAILLDFLEKWKADDEPLSFLTILKSNGLQDAVWALRTLPEEYWGKVRLLACLFAESILPFAAEGEERPRLAIEAARKFVAGEISAEEMQNAATNSKISGLEDIERKLYVGNSAWSAANYKPDWGITGNTGPLASESLSWAREIHGGEMLQEIFTNWLKEFEK